MTKMMVRNCLGLVFCGFMAQKAGGQTLFIDSLINPSSLRQVVEALASDSLEGRFTGTMHAQKAASFIAEEFKKAGAAPLAGNDGYFMPFTAKGNSLIPALNVMAALRGNTKPDELIIFCAHYDHVGTPSTNPFKDHSGNSTGRKGDTIFNGANDNATGVAAVIHLARYFGQLKNNERSIIFIAFSGEELGMQGSQQTASFFKPASVVALINIEMIGRSISGKRRNAYITGSHLSDLQKLMNKKLRETNLGLYGKKFFSKDPFPDANLFARSDNYWFSLKGIPAHTIMASSPDDEYYHSPGDDPSTLDFSLMTTLVKAIAISCTPLIEGIEAPRRINPGNIDSRF
jgi:Zn-dependent M28 family amino/carboxypeptidase